MKTTIRGFFAVGGLAALAACVPMAPPGAVFIATRVGPPPPRVEVVGVAPGPGFVWVRGFWRWEGDDYRWTPGHWTMAPHPRAVWVPGRWRHHPRGWYWVDGYWR